ncbi:TPA: hypothetical protein ACWW29_004973, partial [Klebsiella quasipneumoniae subsp. similipneumoniae]
MYGEVDSNGIPKINRGSLTFWLDDEAIQAWYESA